MRTCRLLWFAQLAEHYNGSQDTADFDDGAEVSLKVKRNVTISVRFSDEEISALRDRAERAGLKVTSFIRAAALEATNPVDRAALDTLVRDLEQRVHDVASFLSRSLRGVVRTSRAAGTYRLRSHQVIPATRQRTPPPRAR